MINKKTKQMTQMSFLIQLYEEDPLISNYDAFARLKRKFPKTKTTQRTLTSSWKYILRKHGVKIPLQRQRKKTAKK